MIFLIEENRGQCRDIVVSPKPSELSLIAKDSQVKHDPKHTSLFTLIHFEQNYQKK